MRRMGLPYHLWIVVGRKPLFWINYALNIIVVIIKFKIFPVKVQQSKSGKISWDLSDLCIRMYCSHKIYTKVDRHAVDRRSKWRHGIFFSTWHTKIITYIIASLLSHCKTDSAKVTTNKSWRNVNCSVYVVVVWLKRGGSCNEVSYAVAWLPGCWYRPINYCLWQESMPKESLVLHSLLRDEATYEAYLRIAMVEWLTVQSVKRRSVLSTSIVFYSRYATFSIGGEYLNNCCCLHWH